MSNNPNVTTLLRSFFPIRREDGILAPFANTDVGESLLNLPPGGPLQPQTIMAPAIERLPLGGKSKRLMDIAVASLALVLAAPVMLVIAACTLAADGGPVIFAHRRVGFSGRPFNCYKFRTMRTDAAEALDKYLVANPEAEREWRERKKLKHDPRITPLGKLLRMSSLDELPQLLNVLRGEMSCIGPRPVVTDELQLYGAAAADYLSARPGITGLWQVSGRSSIGYADRVALDSQYIRDWSPGRDFMILLRTVFAVIRVDHTS